MQHPWREPPRAMYLTQDQGQAYTQTQCTSLEIQQISVGIINRPTPTHNLYTNDSYATTHGDRSLSD